MARPSKLSPAVRDRVVALVRDGSFIRPALRVAGVSTSTHYRWCQRPEPEYVAYRSAVAQAVAEADAVRLAAAVARAAAKDWRAAAWWLEHEFPERWGPRPRR